MEQRRRVFDGLPLALALCVALTTPGTTRATTLVRLDFADLAREAERIVVGTVTGVEGRWDDSSRFVHTDVTLSVERTLRGEASTHLVLRTPGGRVGATGQTAHGAATFEVGERVLVFLTRWDDGVFKVLGYSQGKSRIVREERNRERLRGGAADGLTLHGAILELRDGPSHNIPLRAAH